jgi:hypothetical protein
VAFSPQTNYTEWVTATGRRILAPTFVDRGMSRDQCGETPAVVNLSFLDRSSYCFIEVAPHLCSEIGWTPFQTHCYSENLKRRESNPGPLSLQPGNQTTSSQRRSLVIIIIIIIIIIILSGINLTEVNFFSGSMGVWALLFNGKSK